jgi:hypothetical protein
MAERNLNPEIREELKRQMKQVCFGNLKSGKSPSNEREFVIAALDAFFASERAKKQNLEKPKSRKGIEKVGLNVQVPADRYEQIQEFVHQKALESRNHLYGTMWGVVETALEAFLSKGK